MRTIIIERKAPDKIDLLKLTNKETIKEGCKALGISEETFRNWRKDGMSEKARKKYWSDYEEDSMGSI